MVKDKIALCLTGLFLKSFIRCSLSFDYQEGISFMDRMFLTLSIRPINYLMVNHHIGWILIIMFAIGLSMLVALVESSRN
jgi:hypothetical protein